MPFGFTKQNIHIKNKQKTINEKIQKIASQGTGSHSSGSSGVCSCWAAHGAHQNSTSMIFFVNTHLWGAQPRRWRSSILTGIVIWHPAERQQQRHWDLNVQLNQTWTSGSIWLTCRLPGPQSWGWRNPRWGWRSPRSSPSCLLTNLETEKQERCVTPLWKKTQSFKVYSFMAQRQVVLFSLWKQQMVRGAKVQCRNHWQHL